MESRQTEKKLIIQLQNIYKQTTKIEKMKKQLKTFEVITKDGKGHFVSAYYKKNVTDFFLSQNTKKITARKDIDPKTNFIIN